MVTTWVVVAAVGIAWGQPPRPALTPPEAEAVPLYKVPGPAFKMPCRVPARTLGVLGLELWVSTDGGKTWARAGTLPWDADEAAKETRKEFEFHAKKPGEYWFATRVKYKGDRNDPAGVSELVPAQRVFVTAGYDPAPAKAGLTAGVLDELDDELNRIEIELIRKEVKRLAGSKDFTPEVADRLDRLRSRLRELRLQMERAEDRLPDLRTVPGPLPDPVPVPQYREGPFPEPSSIPPSPGLPSAPRPQSRG